MYLKKLELFGFKSFADRTELEFVQGVTAVVGPNGSGKSNVSDSIRWVLGEQSAKSLRGAKMEDIIFAGSDTRKPLNYCEVTLVLDNATRSVPIDYAEVAITRRVYRSGESEYLLNKQTCRLKDITELFMDTGLGKEAYSIIGQGKIEEIISSKPEDRRGIFEEAAGVVKYKNRKKEAERKLEETEANLVRVRDILYELEDQVEPLRYQAEKAQKYTALKEELTEKEISTYVYLIEQLHERWTHASAALKTWREKQTDLAFVINEKDAVEQKHKAELLGLEQHLEQVQQQLLQLTEEVERLEGQKEVHKERKANFQHNKQELEEKISALKERYSKQQVLVNEADAALQQLKTELDADNNHLQDKEEELNKWSVHTDEKLNELKSDYIETLNRIAALKNERHFITQQAAQSTQKADRLTHENQNLLQQREAILVKKEAAEKEMEQLLEHKDSCRHSYQKVKLSRDQVLNQLEALEEKLRGYLTQHDKIKSRIQLLTEMKEEFNGFFQGVKDVLKVKNTSLKGIHGAVAELIQVPENVVLAIETALGAALQNIVVEDEEAARQAIQYLKQRGSGRATFFPLTVIKSRRMPAGDLELLQKEASFIGTGVDLIHFDSKYNDILGNLLGQVIVVKDLKEANRLARLLSYRYRFVTLDGDIVNPGGSMTGGSSKQNQSGLLARDKELKRLATELEKAELAITEAEDQKKQLRGRLQDETMQLEQLSQQANQLQEEEQVKRETFSQVRYEADRITERLQLFDLEMEQIKRDQSQFSANEKQAYEKLEQEQQLAQRTEREIKEFEQKLKDSSAIKEELSSAITQIKIQLARKIQAYESKREQFTTISAQLHEYQNELEQAETHYTRLAQDMENQVETEEELGDRYLQAKAQKEKLAEELNRYRLQRQQVKEQLTQLEDTLRGLRSEMKQIEQQAHQEELKVNRLDVELENYLTTLSEEYELSFELAKERYPLQDAFEVVKQEVDRIKREIQALGTVNLGAIEEYERVYERYHFLKAQEEDLNQAKQTLYDVIKEMDEEMSQRFIATFELVREQFVETFVQMFGGGRADLVLTDPENLLHTGIEIVAQPPGKKLQNLALLSGGEKALTAIALLFAIIKIKPVPFCVLDEVEAALDEANVYRFAQYLKAFSHKTQFIVITHRKGTMEGADVLYGITMQESGVSNMVAVKLDEKEAFASA